MHPSYYERGRRETEEEGYHDEGEDEEEEGGHEEENVKYEKLLVIVQC